ncbi:unnamed protein product, partial [Prorocentrum cordatum]
VVLCFASHAWAPDDECRCCAEMGPPKQYLASDVVDALRVLWAAGGQVDAGAVSFAGLARAVGRAAGRRLASAANLPASEAGPRGVRREDAVRAGGGWRSSVSVPCRVGGLARVQGVSVHVARLPNYLKGRNFRARGDAGKDYLQ